MKQPSAVLVLLLLSACSSKPFYVKTVADQAASFDAGKPIVVSARDEKDIQQRNLVRALRQVLVDAGYKVTDGEGYQYVLKLERGTATRPLVEHEEVSYRGTTLGSDGTTLDTFGTALVPTQRDAAFTVISLKLWDATDVLEDVPMIWVGAATGRIDAVEGRETEVLRELVSRMGTSGFEKIR